MKEIGRIFHSVSKSQNVLANPSLIYVGAGHWGDPHEVSIIQKELKWHRFYTEEKKGAYNPCLDDNLHLLKISPMVLIPCKTRAD